MSEYAPVNLEEDQQQEIQRLERIIASLMDRAERSLDSQGSDFGLFQTTLALEQTVEQRTAELEQALKANETINRDLLRLTETLREEIQVRREEETLRAGQYAILEMIASDAPLKTVLVELAHWIEQQEGMGYASIVLLGPDNCIGSCYGPSLPAAFNEAFIGFAIGPNRGSCGTAMYRREPIIVSDIAADPLWEEFRAAPLQYGLKACWSLPIVVTGDQVLGSLAIYHDKTSTPTERQLNLVASAVHLAGIAIQRNRTEARIQHMAHHDELTDLPNRTLLMEQVTQAIQQARRAQDKVALLMVDLDRFKDVNDSLGHHTGDLLLCEVAERLSGAVRAGDIVARLGGDEFVIALPTLTESHSPSYVAQKVMQMLSKPFFVQDHTFQLGCSIGISLYPDDGATAPDLLRAADTAMYAAKDHGRGCYQFFTHELNEAAHERMALLSQLQQAIREQEFVLHYQPLFDLQSGQMIGAEALLRWQHPVRGLLYPGQFLFLLEEHGLMVELGNRILQAAIRQAAAWQAGGLPPLRISVNIAADQLYRGNMPALLRGELADSGLDPTRLMLEFTESVLLKHSDAIINTMHEFRKLGIALALDDFGTGYSSLSYLHRFPVDQLKIDRSFVQSLEEPTSSLNIVRSIVNLAASLGLQTVAEGLESNRQRTLMQELGCLQGQGFLLGNPLPAEELETLLAQQRF